MAASRPLSRFWEWGKNIVCVGRNYADHAREMQSAVPSEPVLFLKPSTAYAPEGSPVLMPAYSRNLHHELELAVVMGRRGRAVPEAAAMDYVAGYALCLDMTARDVQDECKKKGLPWTLAKSFTGSCPVSAFVPKEKIPDPHNLKLWLKVNGELRQEGVLSGEKKWRGSRKSRKQTKNVVSELEMSFCLLTIPRGCHCRNLLLHPSGNFPSPRSPQQRFR
uniref:Oxaloacetate tautomerase FAHD1, mitochondrial n=1 Tax=Equus asinus TaxID=9793 RepID=A0A8C4PHV9_EQUAS